MKLLDGELELHVWEQEPELFARVLSPKVYNPDRTFKCLIDQDAIRKRLDEEEMQSSLAPFEGWGVGKGERTYYEPIAAFLNYCVAKCDTIYDSCKGSSLGPFTLREHSERFFENPFFVWFDKLMCDVINGAKPLKPDLLCVDGGPVDRIALKAYWSLVKEKWSAYKRQVAMPIEAKDSWRSLLIQIATYGRALFAVMPLRLFGLGIGVNHAHETISFIIFHRGGLTMSKPLRIMDTREEKKRLPEVELQKNRKQVLKILLSALLWQGPADTGFPCFTDGQIFFLPASFNETAYFQAVVIEVLYYALSIRGRNTIVYRLQMWHRDDISYKDRDLWPKRMVTHAKPSSAIIESFSPTSEADPASKDGKSKSILNYFINDTLFNSYHFQVNGKVRIWMG